MQQKPMTATLFWLAYGLHFAGTVARQGEQEKMRWNDELIIQLGEYVDVDEIYCLIFGCRVKVKQFELIFFSLAVTPFFVKCAATSTARAIERVTA